MATQLKRNAFYGCDASSLSEEFLESFYREYFIKRGFNVDFAFHVVRPQEPNLYAYVFKLSRELR